jgi:hypothetical protein
MFSGAQNVAKVSGNEQGLDDDQTDSRIFNNDDWGAVAYLSQSFYGVCTNIACTTDGVPAADMTPATAQKIWNNGTSQCTTPYPPGRTGYGSGGKSDTCIGNINADNLWYTENGMLASSTHNPTGIYDLAGGVWEYVLGVYDNTLNSATSDITSFDTKYINNYPVPPLDNNISDIYDGDYDFDSLPSSMGQSLAETGGTASATGMWHTDYAISASTTEPWSLRGGNSFVGVGAGVFAISRNTGGASMGAGSRLLLSAP